MLHYRTRQHLEGIAEHLPKTPWAGAQAIAAFLDFHYGYGANENIQQESYVRMPNEVRTHMNCNDAGIYAYLLADTMGLDAILVRFNDTERTGQSHLGTIIRGNRQDYLVENNYAARIKLHPKKVVYIDKKREEGFGSVELMDIPGLLRYRQESNTFRDFLATGQLLIKGYGSMPRTPFSIQRQLKVVDNMLRLRKSVQVPGFYVTAFFEEDRVDVVVSKGVDNDKMIEPHNVFSQYPDYPNRKPRVRINRFREADREKLLKAYLRSHTVNDWLSAIKPGGKTFARFKENRPEMAEPEVELAFAHELLSLGIQKKWFDEAYALLPKHRCSLGIYFGNIYFKVAEQEPQGIFVRNKRIVDKARRIAKREGLRIHFFHK